MGVNAQQTMNPNKLHNEEAFEIFQVEQLVGLQGYIQRSSSDYDKVLALDPPLVIQFIKDSQPDAWKLYESQNGGAAETLFVKEVAKALKNIGTLELLKKGLNLISGQSFRLCYPKPASDKKNADGTDNTVVKLYKKNILSVTRQLQYSEKNNNEIDLVIFLNGIPVVTQELKNEMTGQTIKNAIWQFKNDRKPAGEPLLTYKRGALVHLAVDTNEIQMTTKLNNGKTFFLPLNRGNKGRAGNPEIPNNGIKTSYLFQDIDGMPAILSREILLDLIQNFIQEDGPITIFPRYHQFEAVRQVLAHARQNGAGQEYLVQHSAGSGKTWTIAWSAKGLTSLHDQEDNGIFDTVIIVSDRRVLDGQLQKAVRKLGLADSFIATIGKNQTSRDLKDALEAGKKIVVTTIQKFCTDAIAQMSAMPEKQFAVIIDEAHSSQSGKAADALQGAIGNNENENFDDLDAIEQAIARAQASRGKAKNVSYIAFTATPKQVTLERFGTRYPGIDSPLPFHLYSMRQAVEEGFIVDVLQNYLTYKSYYELEKSIEDNPEFKARKAKRKIARFVHLKTIPEKSEIIVEHFRTHVMHRLEGQAKAMVISGSREEAYWHYRGIKNYIAEKGYNDMNALVAFSGDLPINGDKYTEAELNGFSETELPENFDTQLYHVLVVANKYQTGFDQPKICAIYVDRKLGGLQCVQTLNRANRSMTGKSAKDVFILDFANTIDDIKEAFKPYYEVTALEEVSDPQQIYLLKSTIEMAGFIEGGDIDRFCAIFFKPNLSTTDRAQLEGLINQAANRYNTASKDEQEEFRQAVKSFCRFYTFITQVYHVGDRELEKMYWYCDWLGKKLNQRPGEVDAEITDEMIRIAKFRIEETGSGSAAPAIGETETLPGINRFGVNAPVTEEDEMELSEILKEFNAKHGTEFTEEDLIRYGQQAAKVAEEHEDLIVNNPEDVSFNTFNDALLDRMLDLAQHEKEVDNIMSTDEESFKRLSRFLLTYHKRVLTEKRNSP